MAQNRSEQIVEIVRDTAGELTYNLHLLRLTELLGKFLPLLFRPLVLGDVFVGSKDADHLTTLITKR